MATETYREIHRRLGLPEIPQDLIDKAKRELEEQERVLSEPARRERRLAETEELLARFRRPQK